MEQFTASQKVSTVSTCDSECMFNETIIKRTAKTVTLAASSMLNEEKRVKIHSDENGSEFIFPYGQYSMAPIFRA